SGGRDLVANRQHRKACFKAAGAPEQMSGHGFRGTHGYLVSVLAEGPLDGRSLCAIADLGRGAVSVDIVHLFWLNTGVAQRVTHHTERAIAIVRRSSYVEGVRAHAITHNFRDD